MRYCNSCHRITIGDPLFCNFCGRSYDFKLCPHHHPNPRNAEICSQCGFRELSTPHPRVSFWLMPLVALLTAPGLLLIAVTTLFIFATIRAVLSNQELMFQAVIAGLMLALLWFLYMHLPAFLRHFLSRLFDRRNRGNHDH